VNYNFGYSIEDSSITGTKQSKTIDLPGKIWKVFADHLCEKHVSQRILRFITNKKVKSNTSWTLTVVREEIQMKANRETIAKIFKSSAALFIAVSFSSAALYSCHSISESRANNSTISQTIFINDVLQSCTFDVGI